MHVLHDFRRNCDVLIALGQCAIMGGLPAMRNAIMHSDAPLQRVSGRGLSLPVKYIRNTTHNVPNDPALPLLAGRGLSLLARWWRSTIKIPGMRADVATSFLTRLSQAC